MTKHTHQTSVRTNSVAAPVEYEKYLDCVHCGLCTAACPTYVETGDENNSPRGRIYLMRSVTDGRLELTPAVKHHLELCLDCRACETACPSGVQYGRLIEPFRVQMDEQAAAEGKGPDWFHRWILFRIFPYAETMRRALIPARLAQRLGLDRFAQATGLLRLLPTQLKRMVELLPPATKKELPLPEFLPAHGKRRARVALFTGCVGDAVFRHVNWATARVLQANGCDVAIPQNQQCCGAIHFHAGQAAPARDFADANLAALKPADFDAIVVNIAGCGAMLKDYGHHWNDAHRTARSEFAAKVRDVHEFLADLRPIAPTGEINQRIAYHDACHLAHAQGVRQPPRELLRQIPGLELVDIAESELCCGAAGSYNLTQPDMADRLSSRKLDHILASGARTVAAANAGCLLQIMREAKLRGKKLRVMHPMEILDASYRQVALD